MNCQWIRPLNEAIEGEQHPTPETGCLSNYNPLWKNDLSDNWIINGRCRNVLWVGENLERLLLLGKTTTNQASNYRANNNPMKSRLLVHRVRKPGLPIIQIPNEPDTAESTEYRTKRNHSHCGCPKFALFGLRFFPALLLFVWLLAHVGKTLTHPTTEWIPIVIN